MQLLCSHHWCMHACTHLPVCAPGHRCMDADCRASLRVLSEVFALNAVSSDMMFRCVGARVCVWHGEYLQTSSCQQRASSVTLTGTLSCTSLFSHSSHSSVTLLPSQE